MSAIPALIGIGEDRAAVPSSSNSHNSNGVVENSTPDLPFHLTGSQRKTAHALRLNAETMLKGTGIDSAVFATFTVGDRRGKQFVQVFDSIEASRRWNSLATGLLADIFERAIVVTERHKNKAIHFHVIGVLRGRPDVRSGFDHESLKAANVARSRGFVDSDAERAYKRAAHRQLRALWAMLLRKLQGYGFGRSELTPIRKSGEAVASYVSKYVEKNLFNRLSEDKGKRLVRYMGWEKRQLKPNEFGWGTRRAAAWRSNARTLAAFVGAGHANVAQAFGPRWAWKLTALMNVIKGENQSAFAFRSYLDLCGARSITFQAATHRWQKSQWREAA